MNIIWNAVFRYKQWHNRRRFGNCVKINIGAGPVVSTSGWLNLDYLKSGWTDLSSARIDINWDIRNGIPFGNGTVCAIYMSHVLEHLNWNEGIKLLKECSRILKNKAVIRIIVPDADYFFRKFIDRNEAFFANPALCYNNYMGNMTDTFLWNFLGAYAYESRNLGCHSMAYNEENLTYRLKSLGFSGIARKKFGETDFSDYADELKFFPCRCLPRKMGDNSLFIEAVK